MKKILIIEDDADLLDLVGYILTTNGFEIIPSQHKLSLTQIIALQPNLVIIDHVLHSGFGSDLCHEIKSSPLTAHLPVILFSAINDLDILAAKSCADAFIIKPFDIEDFLATVVGVVSNNPAAKVDGQSD